MDLTVAVMLPPKGDATYSRSAHTKMPVLAPVAVYERAPVATIRNPVLGYLRVTDCPVRSARELAEKICVPDERETVIGQETTRTTEAKRLYEADAALLPAKITATLLADRQATLTWAEFSAMYANRQTAQKLSAVVADGVVRG